MAIPHRFSEPQFRRYERYITHAVEAFPQAVKCDPNLFDVATVTFIARLRDAMKSYHDHNWHSVTLDRTKFLSSYGQIQVVHRTDGTILIGPRTAVQAWGKQDGIGEQPIAIANENPDKILNLLSREEKDLIMQLSHNRWLAPRLRVKGLSVDEVEKFQQQYDIAVDDNNDGTYTII